MSDALAAAPAIVAAVLAWAGVSKLRLSGQARYDALSGLGLPTWLERRWVADLHPLGELALAALLLGAVGWVATVASGLALLLCLTYLMLVARAVSGAGEATCACFGGEAPLGPRTVARNAVLVAVAGVAFVDALAGHGFRARLADQGWPGVAWMVALIAAGVTTYAIVRAEAPAGEPAADPEFAIEPDPTQERLPVPEGLVLRDEHGRPRELHDLLATEGPQLLVFGSLSCRACAETFADLPHYAALLAPIKVRCVVLGTDQPAEPPAFPIWHDPDRLVSAGLSLPTTTPISVLLGVDGLTAGTATGRQEIRGQCAVLSAQMVGVQL